MNEQNLMSTSTRLPEFEGGISRAPVIPSELNALRRELKRVQGTPAARELIRRHAIRLHEANSQRTAGLVELGSRFVSLRLMKKILTEFHVPASIAELARLEELAAEADERLMTSRGKQRFAQTLDAVEEALARWDELTLGNG